MKKIRIIGPRARLPSAIRTLQDLGIVHMATPPADPPLHALQATPRQARHVALVGRAVDDVEVAISRLDGEGVSVGRVSSSSEPLAREIRLARRARRSALDLSGQLRALQDELARLGRLIEALEAFGELDAAERPGVSVRVFLLLLTGESGTALESLQSALTEAIGETHAVATRPLSGGDLAVLLTVPAAQAEEVEALLPERGVRDFDISEGGPGSGRESILARLLRRRARIEGDVDRLLARRRMLAAWLMPGLLRARARLNDWLIANAAMSCAAVSPQLFVLEGWLPALELERLGAALAASQQGEIVVEEIGREEWSVRDVPVAIRNPRIFRPFEVITRWLPMPRYGTMDPTPFVAVFFPMFFGLILADMGYGAVLGAIAVLLWRRSTASGPMRSIAQIAATCSAFSLIFGLFFGELFGDLGHHWLGMRPVAFSREEAFVPFLLLAVAIGFVHMLLGLVLGMLSGFRGDPRGSMGRGLTATMLVLTAAMLLAALNVLPWAFFTPTALALLLSFPLLIILEGAVGPIEFLSRLSNILSYARIMALGTASVMLAVVANRMVGAMGGAVVGVLFATLFHIVNFGLGVFSPTVHSLRLHFVEFFGTFYSPGGQSYRPFRHWQPTDPPPAQAASA